MNRLFSLSEPPSRQPIFVYGEYRNDRAMGWIFQGMGPPRSARVRGWLWHLGMGRLALAPDPGGRWIPGELHEIADPARVRMVLGLAAAEQPPTRLLTVRVLVEGRAVWAQTWGARGGELKRMGAHRLAAGDLPRGWSPAPLAVPRTSG